MSGVETSALDQVREWALAGEDLHLRRSSDGLEIVFCCNPERAKKLVEDGVVVFTPLEIVRLAEARGACRDEGDVLSLRALVAKAIDVKRAIPGTRLDEIEELR